MYITNYILMTSIFMVPTCIRIYYSSLKAIEEYDEHNLGVLSSDGSVLFIPQSIRKVLGLYNITSNITIDILLKLN